MPIEIRELIIKASINSNEGDPSNINATPSKKKDVEINEIVDLIFEKIKEKLER